MGVFAWSEEAVVFEPLTLNCRSNTVIRLSDALISEMTSVTVLATLALVNLRARFASFEVATDASNDVIAGVRAQIDEKDAQEMARHVIRKGVWSRLLPPGQALLRQHGLLEPDDEVPADGYRTNPLWETLARAENQISRASSVAGLWVVKHTFSTRALIQNKK